MRLALCGSLALLLAGSALLPTELKARGELEYAI